LRIRPTAPGRESLEAGDREQPSGDGGAALKSASLLPDIKEHVAQKILGRGLVADEPEQPTIEFSAMSGEQHLHASLSPAAMRSTSISSEEFSTDVAAFAGTAALDLDLSHVPPNQTAGRGKVRDVPSMPTDTWSPPVASS